FLLNKTCVYRCSQNIKVKASIIKMSKTIIIKSQLRLIFENGTHPDSGKPVYKTKTFNNVVSDASADQLYAVGTAVAQLQELPLHEINRGDTSLIDEE